MIRLKQISEAKFIIDSLWTDNAMLLGYIIDRNLADDFAEWRARWDRKCEEERHGKTNN